MTDDVIREIPVIRSKKDAELFLMFLMKYKDRFDSRFLQVFDYCKFLATWDGMNSAKPFTFRIITSTNDRIYHTFTEAIQIIFDYRKYINELIKNKNGSWFMSKFSSEIFL